MKIRADIAAAALLVAALACGCAPEAAATRAGGSESGSVSASAQVTPPEPAEPEPVTDLAEARITVEDQTFTGLELTPEVTVELDGKTLTQDADYTLAYADNTDIGTATVTIAAAGEYEGSTSANFEIEPHAQGWDTIDGYHLYYTAESAIATNSFVPGDDDMWFYVGAYGTPVTDCWVQASGGYYYIGADGHPLTNAWLTTDGGRYYLGSDGVMLTGLQTIDGEAYIFNADGSLRYISNSERLDRIVCRIIRDRTGFSIREVYDYVAYSFTYVFMDVDRSYAGWMEDYSLRMWDEGRGNCYGFSALFHFIMRAIGYETTVIDGDVIDRWYDYIVYDHCWVELNQGGVTYVLDPVFDNPRWNQPSYYVTYADNKVNGARFEYVL